MISSISVYGLKMQWMLEYVQWLEQYFDIILIIWFFVYKVEVYRGYLQCIYQYVWVNDDIFVLIVFNLLKKYVEKYFGILEGFVD